MSERKEIKASELVRQLNELIEQHGDRNVWTYLQGDWFAPDVWVMSGRSGDVAAVGDFAL